MPGKQDVYERVTSKIIADLERGTLTWRQPWQAAHQAGSVCRPLRAEGKPYRGINVMMLWASAIEKGYGCPIWMTYNQAAEIGGQVAQRRNRIAGRLRRHLHQDRHRRKRRRRGKGHPFHEGIHRLQCRADRRPAGAFLRGQSASRQRH